MLLTLQRGSVLWRWKYEYGDFLKAARGRQQSPPRRDSNSSGSSGDRPMQPTEFSKQPMELMATVVEEFRSKSPNFHDKDETEDSGKAVFSGETEITGTHVVPDFMQTNRHATEDSANGKEVLATMTLSPDSQQNLKSKKDIPDITNNISDTILSEELQGDTIEFVASSDFPNIQVDSGPLVSKPKLTWTCINRMGNQIVSDMLELPRA